MANLEICPGVVMNRKDIVWGLVQIRGYFWLLSPASTRASHRMCADSSYRSILFGCRLAQIGWI